MYCIFIYTLTLSKAKLLSPLFFHKAFRVSLLATHTLKNQCGTSTSFSLCILEISWNLSTNSLSSLKLYLISEVFGGFFDYIFLMTIFSLLQFKLVLFTNLSVLSSLHLSFFLLVIETFFHSEYNFKHFVGYMIVLLYRVLRSILLFVMPPDYSWESTFLKCFVIWAVSKSSVGVIW